MARACPEGGDDHRAGGHKEGRDQRPCSGLLTAATMGGMSIRVPLGPLAGPLGRDLRASALRAASVTVPGPPVAAATVVTDHELDGLPEPAQRYLRAMGVVGRPRDWSFLVRFSGRFKRPGRPWMSCEAWQYNANRPIVRIFDMRIDVAHVVPMVGRDSYVDGCGSMRGKVLGLVTVADGSGPEFDLGELVTYLNDALVLAPSMLLDGSTTWAAVDEHSFDLTLTDGANRVTARAFVGPDGLLRDFSTEDRWCDLPTGLVRARWTTPFAGWTDVDGRPWLTGARAVWELPGGPLPYIEGTFVPDSIVRNVAPGELA